MAVVLFWWLVGFALLPLVTAWRPRTTIDVSTLERRLPVRGVHDELDRVAESFNETLGPARAGGRRHAPVQRRARPRTAHAAGRAARADRARASRHLAPARARRDGFASQIEEIDRLTRLIDRILTLARAESGQIPAHLLARPPRRPRTVPRRAGGADRRRRARSSCASGPIGAVVVDGDAGVAGTDAPEPARQRAQVHPAARPGRGSGLSARGLGARSTWTTRAIGLSADDAQHVFERFFRADPARSSTTDGAGLGLSLVEVGRGTAPAERSPSAAGSAKGSTFTVTLPIGRG